MPLKFALTFRYCPTRLHHYTTTPLHYYTHTDRNEMSSFFCWYLYPLIYPSYWCFFISIGVQVECRSSCAMFMNVFVFVWVCLCVYRCICVCDKFERFIPIWVVLFLLLCGCCFVLPQLISMILWWDKHFFSSNKLANTWVSNKKKHDGKNNNKKWWIQNKCIDEWTRQ